MDVAWIVHVIFTTVIALAVVVALLKFILRLKAFGDLTIVVLSMISCEFIMHVIIASMCAIVAGWQFSAFALFYI